MLATTMVGPGPMSIAPSPVPHGCEHVPAVRTGIGIHDIIKIAAPTIAVKALNPGFLAARFLISARPHIIKGIDNTNQSPAHGAGKMPSDMCIAYAGLGNAGITINANGAAANIFLKLFFTVYFLKAAIAFSAAAATGLPPLNVVLVI